MAANPPSADTDRRGPLGLSATELRALEATRFRLQNLSKSIASFQNDLARNRPLPNPCVFPSVSRVPPLLFSVI